MSEESLFILTGETEASMSVWRGASNRVAEWLSPPRVTVYPGDPLMPGGSFALWMPL